MGLFFCKTKDLYGCLTNFYHRDFTFNGKVWKSSEHCYQAHKFLEEEKQELIRNQPNAFMAAKTGREITGMRKDWDDIKVAIMLNILIAKFSQHNDIKELLIGSYPNDLYELSYRDPFWGTKPDKLGINMLGRLLMVVRTKLMLQK